MTSTNNDKSSFKNPILPGFYPDPSICRVEKDYYLVTSSFSYFPGIPVLHSRHLVNWKQIGHVHDRPSQLVIDNGAGGFVGTCIGMFACSNTDKCENTAYFNYFSYRPEE